MKFNFMKLIQISYSNEKENVFSIEIVYFCNPPEIYASNSVSYKHINITRMPTTADILPGIETVWNYAANVSGSQCVGRAWAWSYSNRVRVEGEPEWEPTTGQIKYYSVLAA